MGAKILAVVAAAILLGLLYWAAPQFLPELQDKKALQSLVEEFGAWGPALIIGLMSGAIVFTPIPSGPIAVAAGAAYGPLWGTLYIVIGAEIGALTAFWLARWLGHGAIRRWWPSAASVLDRLGGKRSQLWLTAVVFGSRLVPFISFDAVSYAAGLTPLSFWRFALATFAGVLPISFALAYFGEHLVQSQYERLGPILVILGAVTLVPFVIKLAWRSAKPVATERVMAADDDQQPPPR